MSDFDLSSMLPFYLDEADEQIAGLNEMLLSLERTPGDEKVLREAFRMMHSIKGSSTVMGTRPSCGRRTVWAWAQVPWKPYGPASPRRVRSRS